MSQAAGVFSPASNRRFTLVVGGHVFDRWSAVKVTRRLRDISGEFEVNLVDSGRLAQAFSPDLDPMPPFAVLKAGMACAVALDGELVLQGWIDVVEVEEDAEHVTASVRGRDATGDLVDCAAAPTGPAEWKGLTALQIAQAICKPFGIPVRADVDVGAVFPVFGLLTDENAMPAIERAARQRALLLVSDGVGGLILTRGGNTRAPAPLQRPGNIVKSHRSSSWAQRFSDYYVKGQTNKISQRVNKLCKITPGIDPASAPVAPPGVQDTEAEQTTVVMTGHAIDPEITRYRPNVRGVKTQSGSASVQAQAEWAARVAKGMGEQLTYRVLDWRAGEGAALWKLNQLVDVTDGYADINQDMLISGLSYCMNEQDGEFTELELSGRTAFDRIDESAKSKRFLFKKSPKSFGPTRNG